MAKQYNTPGQAKVVFRKSGICGFLYVLECNLAEVFAEHCVDFGSKILGSVKTEIVADEVDFFKVAYIGADYLGVICNNGAVIVIVAETFVDVVGHTGIEDVLYTLLEK